MIAGVRIPRWATHIPLLEAAQFGATIRRVRDSLVAAGAKREEKGKPLTETQEHPLTEGAMAAARGLIGEVPFVKTPEELWADAKEGRRGVVKFAGQQVKSMIPGVVQDIAGRLDRDSEGNTVRRKPEGFVDEIAAGVPWWRRSVREREQKKKEESTPKPKSTADYLRQSSDLNKYLRLQGSSNRYLKRQ
jgi:hypothetical protein